MMVTWAISRSAVATLVMAGVVAGLGELGTRATVVVRNSDSGNWGRLEQETG